MTCVAVCCNACLIEKLLPSFLSLWGSRTGLTGFIFDYVPDRDQGRDFATEGILTVGGGEPLPMSGTFSYRGFPPKSMAWFLRAERQDQVCVQELVLMGGEGGYDGGLWVGQEVEGSVVAHTCDPSTPGRGSTA